MDVFPDFGAVGGAEQLRSIIGALMTLVLITSVLMMIVNGAIWALASSSGNFQTATRARTGFFVSCGASVLAGACVAWTNFLLWVGISL